LGLVYGGAVSGENDRETVVPGERPMQKVDGRNL